MVGSLEAEPIRHNPTRQRRVRAVSIVEAIVADLRQSILTGRVSAGEPLTELEVSQQYDVARPTAKAAIEALVGAGLLTRAQHKTARVIELGPEDVRDIYRTRATLEAQVLRELAGRRHVSPAARAANAEIAALPEASAVDVVEPDMRFHSALVDAIGSERLSRMYGSLATEVRLCMSRVQGRNLLPTALIAGEHERLLQLIEEGEADAAVALLTEHLGRARERLVGAVGGQPGSEAELDAVWDREAGS